MADLTPEALRRHQQLELLAPTAVTVNGQATLWHVLLRNLLDNALRHSPDGAKARLQVRVLENGHIEVTVEDSGPGISTENRARLGERFFRVLGTAATGSGLGWSIVRHVALLQHIRVALGTSADLGGLRVTLHYPASKGE